MGVYDPGANGPIQGLSTTPHEAASLAVANCASSPSSPGGSPAGQTQAAIQQCVDRFHLHTIVTYLPSSRYWVLQWSEAAIFVAGAVALIGVGLWWIRNRIA